MHPMNNPIQTVINRGELYFLVSTVYATLSPVGWETLVFRCEPDGTVNDWLDIAAVRYANEDQARAGHKKMVDTFEVN